MTKAVLMATTALVALLDGSTAPARAIPTFITSTAGKTQPPLANPKARTLYTQNSNKYGDVGAVSQNFTSGIYTSYDNRGADDFIIPAGKNWKVGRVDVTGVYFNGSGPAQSVNVIFWKDYHGYPGNAVAHGTYDDLSCADRSGSFSCRLPKRLQLKAGHYWVTVQANCSYYTCGEWSWDETSVIHNDAAEWEEYYTFGGPCPTWDTLANCLGSYFTGDLMFDLKT